MKYILASLGLVGSLMGVPAKDGLFRRSPSWFVQILSIELAAARVCQTPQHVLSAGQGLGYALQGPPEQVDVLLPRVLSAREASRVPPNRGSSYQTILESSGWRIKSTVPLDGPGLLRPHLIATCSMAPRH